LLDLVSQLMLKLYSRVFTIKFQLLAANRSGIRFPKCMGKNGSSSFCLKFFFLNLTFAVPRGTACFGESSQLQEARSRSRDGRGGGQQYGFPSAIHIVQRQRQPCLPDRNANVHGGFISNPQHVWSASCHQGDIRQSLSIVTPQPTVFSFHSTCTSASSIRGKMSFLFIK
jgi:hypothetical protein